MQNMIKVALVTGASRGIGRAIAQRLARDGSAVAVNYARSPELATEVVDAIAASGGQAAAFRADIGDPADVRDLFDQVLDRFGRIDVVVNNAGVTGLSPMAQADVESFDRVLHTNLRGAFNVLGQAARHVESGGRIIAFSSSVIAKAFPGYGAYIASKAGVEGLVRVLANELRGRSVTVNAVAPGPVATELFLGDKSAEEVERLAAAPPLERLGEPHDIADVVSFLAGPEGGWINGQVVRANGGFA